MPWGILWALLMPQGWHQDRDTLEAWPWYIHPFQTELEKKIVQIGQRQFKINALILILNKVRHAIV